MTIDKSAVGSVLGVSAKYVDLREGSVLYLPQRVAVIAQGETGVAFSTNKWTSTGAAAAGKKFGWRSPIYQMLAQLQPANGDGLGTIQVDVFPLSDNGSGVAATGTVTPSGTMTEASGYRFRAAGVLSKEFVIPEGAIVLNDLLRDMGAKCTEAITFPCTVGWTYGSVTAGALVGTGNGTLTLPAVHAGKYPKPGIWTLENTSAVVNGGVWKLTDPDGVVAATAITQTVGVGAVSVFSDKAGLDFTVTDGTTDFALGAKFTITVPATNLKLITAWKGLSANDVVLEVIGDTSLGVTFALVQPTGGLANPEIDAALDKIGNVWETMAVSGLNIEDTTALDTYNTWGEGRWEPTVRRPLVVFTGNTLLDIDDATAISDSRPTDRINCQIVAPGSVNLPCVVAARAVARIAKVANNVPAKSYQKQRLTGLIAGDDADQWNATLRDLAVTRGSSTITVNDGEIQICDVQTFWRPEGEEPPGWNYVVNIVKIQNCIFNFDIEFAKEEWASAPVVKDEDAVTLPEAKKPKMFVDKACQILDNLGDAALIANVAAAKKATTAALDSQNPNRVNVKPRFPLSSNANIIDIDMEFGYLFPAA